MLRDLGFVSVLVLLLAACGGGGSSSGPAPLADSQVGGLSLLVGDGPIEDENIEAVNITIEQIILLGPDGQRVISDETLERINLLELRNITELLFDGDVPAGDYTKIRLQISRIEIILEDGTDSPAQLPGGGKIDLNPQGTFNIAPGEDLVVQIDIELDRSIHIVVTGNSRYKFRPVVFIDVLDQTDRLRLVKLFGDIVADRPDSLTSDIDLCRLAEASFDDACVDVRLIGDTPMYAADGMRVDEVDALQDQTGHIFGHYELDADGNRFFNAVLIALGPEDSLEQIHGDVASVVDAGAFQLVNDDVSYNVLVDNALRLDGMGDPLVDPIGPGQEAEAWAQSVVRATAEGGDFPAFLVQIKPDDDEDSAEGLLAGVDGDVITLLGDAGEVCVVYTPETEIQQHTETTDSVNSEMIRLEDLATLVDQSVQVDAFGELVEGCVIADLIVVEVDSVE